MTPSSTSKTAVELELARSWPPDEWNDVTVVVAVSSGADSVALLRALDAIRHPGPGRLCIAHFNHRLRASAAVDEAFVRRLGDELNVAVEVGAADGPLRGDESESRNRRYEFLRLTAAKLGARFVATAHTADDQAETVLHRVLRGTGLTGLAGIPRVRNLTPDCVVIRPLLTVRRAELRHYLQGLGQTFREDPSNHETDFTRNRIRLELIPQLERDYNPKVQEALARCGMLAAEADRVVGRLVEQLSDQSVQRRGPLVTIDCEQLARADDYVVRRLLVQIWEQQRWPRQAMDQTAWTGLAALVATPPAETARDLPGGVRAVRSANQLILERRLPGDSTC